jgi:hypothetical protein
MEEQKKLVQFRGFENVVEAYEKDWVHPDLYLEMKARETMERIHVVEVVEDNGFKCIRYEVR